MGKILLCLILLGSLGVLSGCYQVHSDDDLRTIPVTNNPNIVPNQGMRLPSAPI
jgi:hypothetical protein